MNPSPPVVAIESDGTDLFIEVDGQRIAKRLPKPDYKWLVLVPGWRVEGGGKGRPLDIEITAP